MYTLEDLREAHRAGYEAGQANGYSSTAEDEYMRGLEWEAKYANKSTPDDEPK